MSHAVAILGFGWVAREVWAPLLAAHDAFAVRTVVEPSARARAAAGEAFPRASLHAALDDLPRGADVAFVTLPNHLHASAAARALDAGAAPFVEKPLCTSPADLARLRAAVAGAGGAPVFASRAARLRADVRQLAGLVCSGALGKPRHVRLEWVRARGIPGRYGWFTTRGAAGGGVLIDLGWHLLDIGLELLGWPAVVDAAAHASADRLADPAARAAWRGAEAGAGTSADVEDTLTGFLTTDARASISIHVAWGSHRPVDVTSIAVSGTKAEVALRTTFGFSPHRLRESTLTITQGGNVRSSRAPRERPGTEYARELDRLAAGLDTRGDAGRDLDEAAVVLAAVEALYRAAGVA